MKKALYRINRWSKLFVIYFPVILVAGQVLVNLSSFLVPEWYIKSAFYLNLSFGTNILFSLMLVRMVYMFRMCAVSRAAAWAEVAFAVNYAVVQQDNTYNVMFQIIVGIAATIATFWHYVKKFPLCNMSLVTGFIGSVIKKGSCEKGFEHYQRNVKSLLLKDRHRRHHHQ